jgi:hypothetical protein
MKRWAELKYLMRRMNRRNAEQELEQEIRAHLELETQEKIEKGLAPEEARDATKVDPISVLRAE